MKASLQGIPIVGTVPYDNRLVRGIIQDADQQHMTPTDVLTELLPSVDGILKNLLSFPKTSSD